jgi:hypothetical protein
MPNFTLHIYSPSEQAYLPSRKCQRPCRCSRDILTVLYRTSRRSHDLPGAIDRNHHHSSDVYQASRRIHRPERPKALSLLARHLDGALQHNASVYEISREHRQCLRPFPDGECACSPDKNAKESITYRMRRANPETAASFCKTPSRCPASTDKAFGSFLTVGMLARSANRFIQ